MAAAAAGEETVICTFIEMNGTRCVKKCGKYKEAQRCGQHPPSRIQRPECKTKTCVNRARAAHGFCKDCNYRNMVDKPSLPTRPCRFPEEIVQTYADSPNKLMLLKHRNPLLGQELEDAVFALRLKEYAKSEAFISLIQPHLPKELRRGVENSKDEAGTSCQDDNDE